MLSSRLVDLHRWLHSRAAWRDLYIGAVVLGAAALFAAAAAHPTLEPWDVWGCLLLFGAMVVTERMSVRLPRDARLSIATIPHLVAVLLLPSWLTMALAGGSMLVDQLAARADRRKGLFNIASILVTVGVASLVADQMGLGREALGRADQWQQAPAFLLVAAVYYGCTNVLLAIVMSLTGGRPAHRIVLDNARFALPAEFAVCGMGGLIAVLWTVSPNWAPLLLFPVVISQVALTYVSSSKRSHARLAFIAEASRLLGLTSSEDELPPCVASLAVPMLGETCLVYLLEEHGSIQQAARAHANGAAPGVWEWLGQGGADGLSMAEWVGDLVRHGRAVLIPRLHDEKRAASPRAEAQRRLTHLGAQSLMVVPMVAGERALGALVLLTGAPGRRYGADDLELAEELARRCAVALDKARLHAEAKQAARLRDEFLSVAAHELKTPMTSLRGYVQLLGQGLSSDKPVDPRVLAKGLRVIDSQSEKLTQLTGQLLDVSRIEAGKLQLEPREVDLTALISGLAAAAQASTDRHVLQLELPERCPAVVDPLRLEQVVTNLLSNAIKYSPEGGPIDLTLAPTPSGAIRLAVRDRGMGIPPARRAHLFERFYQAHGEGHFGGLGLGLFISRQIVDLHGGSLEADFPADGGTRFTVTLPAHPDQQSLPIASSAPVTQHGRQSQGAPRSARAVVPPGELVPMGVGFGAFQGAQAV